MVKRTEKDRAHNKRASKRFTNNVVVSDKAEDVTEEAQLCDVLIASPLSSVGIGIRTEGLEGDARYTITINKDNGSEMLSGVLQDEYEVIKKDKIAGGSTLCISVSTDGKIDKVYITVIGDYRGSGT